MTDRADEHNRVILDQFTKQAISFSQMQNHSPELILNAAQVNANDTVLDVACGPGLMACEFAAIARHVTGIDLVPAMIERAQALQASQGRTNITWKVGDVLPLPFPDASFSLVFTRYSFHHFLDPQSVLREMVRVCSRRWASHRSRCFHHQSRTGRSLQPRGEAARPVARAGAIACRTARLISRGRLE